MMRTIDRGGVIIGTMTPVNGMTWIYNGIWEKSGERGIECFVADMDTNPHLSKTEKDRILAGLTDEEKKIRKEGRFVQLHGLIYPQFKEERHCIESFEIPSEWRRVVAVDPHLAKETSVLWATIASWDVGRVTKGDWVVYRELRSDGIIPDIVVKILVANGRDRVYARLGDPALNIKDNITGENPFDTFANEGFPLTPANKKVESGIYEIRRLLDSVPPKIYVFKDCIGVIDEFRHYVFNDVRSDESKSYSEKIRKRKDDYLDCLRYIINSGIMPGINGDRSQPLYVYDSRTGRIKGIANAR